MLDCSQHTASNGKPNVLRICEHASQLLRTPSTDYNEVDFDLRVNHTLHVHMLGKRSRLVWHTHLLISHSEFHKQQTECSHEFA